MRKDIKMLCVTNWNAVLHLKSTPKRKNKISNKIIINSLIRVADPDAIDAGMWLSIRDIKLVARIKQLK